MTHSEAWYVVKQPDGHCEIVQGEIVEDERVQGNVDPMNRASETSSEKWGPYPSQSEAIARRVGLIRAGKCQPV